MSKAFLSHSSSQKSLVEKVAIRLGKDNVLLDKWSFDKGSRTVEEIVNAIDRANVYVLFISEEALNSEWVQREMRLVYERLVRGDIRVFQVFNLSLSVSHDDERIPSWIQRKYNVQPEFNAIIIANKIFNKILEMRMANSVLFKAKENLFAGRNDLVQKLEEMMYSNHINAKKCLVISGVEGVGRRTFARKSLKGKLALSNENYYPISIALDDNESVEDFIVKLANISTKDELNFYLNSDATIESKIEIAKGVMNEYIKANEIIFIIDNGAIMLPGRGFATWFNNLMNSLPNCLCICVVSKYKMSFDSEKKNDYAIHINVPLFKPIDRAILFNRYLSIHSHKLSEDDSSFFVKLFNGMPEQITYAADMIISEGLHGAKKSINKIIDFGEAKVKYLVEMFESNNKALELLSLLSQLSYISRDYLNEIIGADEEYEQIMDIFLSVGVYENVGPAKEDIHVNSAIADYVQRNKIAMSGKHISSLRRKIKDSLVTDENVDEFNISDFLANMRAAIIAKVNINGQNIIPSFFLKNILHKYNEGYFSTVIDMCYAFLAHPGRYDEQIIYDVKYTLCQSLARLKDIRFEREVEFFTSTYQFFFLKGFYARMKRELPEAKQFMVKALKLNKNSAKAKREMVNILLMQNDYGGALVWAHENYINSRSNALHVQAYFTCLVKRHELTVEEYDMIENLLREIQSTVHYKGTEIKASMNAEYIFYIKKERNTAIESLNNYLKMSPNSSYVKTTIASMYRSTGRISEAEKIMNDIDVE